MFDSLVVCPSPSSTVSETVNSPGEFQLYSGDFREDVLLSPKFQRKSKAPPSGSYESSPESWIFSPTNNEVTSDVILDTGGKLVTVNECVVVLLSPSGSSTVKLIEY